MTQPAPKSITLVIPVFNEAPGLSANIQTILQALQDQHLTDQYHFSLILVDDGSQDDTPLVIQSLESQDKRIQGIQFVRNFGKEAAILAGLKAADAADAVLVMDSDLQHPPSLIGAMLGLWEAGHKVVNAVKQQRGNESFSSRLFAEGFYRLFYWASGHDIVNHSDFKLLDQEVVQAYCALPERRRFFRGLVNWLGYPAAQIHFAVAPRSGGGQSAWTRLRLLRYAVTALTDFSVAPLYLIIWLGGAVILLGVLLAAITLLQKFSGMAADGFTTLIIFLFITSGAIMLSLGLIGHYLGALFLELKQRPTYLIKRQATDDDDTT
ncbi:MAG: glycosyltransferase [Methylococcaceae bacterium]|nr:MAG: glycosyltransferase [Methylococcaceae bacterium]